LSVNITSQEVGLAVVAGLLSVIGWAMAATEREFDSFI
jgi:preprotein translocase subunit SecF